jgi:hypothetical protein
LDESIEKATLLAGRSQDRGCWVVVCAIGALAKLTGFNLRSRKPVRTSPLGKRIRCDTRQPDWFALPVAEFGRPSLSLPMVNAPDRPEGDHVSIKKNDQSNELAQVRIKNLEEILSSHSDHKDPLSLPVRPDREWHFEAYKCTVLPRDGRLSVRGVRVNGLSSSVLRDALNSGDTRITPAGTEKRGKFVLEKRLRCSGLADLNTNLKFVLE